MTYIPGDPWAICDMCGFKRRHSEMRMNYKHQLVCADTCWEPKHPLENIRTIKEKTWVRDARPEPTDKFIVTVNEDTGVYENEVSSDDL